MSLTIRADGSTSHQVVGASPFRCHWIYDAAGTLVAKSGMIDFDRWYREAFGAHSPWGDEDSPALVTVAESALERHLSAIIMERPDPGYPASGRGRGPGPPGRGRTRTVPPTRRVLGVSVNGERLAEVGPGAVGANGRCSIDLAVDRGEGAQAEELYRKSLLSRMLEVDTAVHKGDAGPREHPVVPPRSGDAVRGGGKQERLGWRLEVEGVAREEGIDDFGPPVIHCQPCSEANWEVPPCWLFLDR